MCFCVFSLCLCVYVVCMPEVTILEQCGLEERCVYIHTRAGLFPAPTCFSPASPAGPILPTRPSACFPLFPWGLCTAPDRRLCYSIPLQSVAVSAVRSVYIFLKSPPLLPSLLHVPICPQPLHGFVPSKANKQQKLPNHNIALIESVIIGSNLIMLRSLLFDGLYCPSICSHGPAFVSTHLSEADPPPPPLPEPQPLPGQPFPSHWPTSGSGSLSVSPKPFHQSI